MEAHEGHGYLPFEMLADFLRAGTRRGVRFLLYSDFEWNNDYNPDTMYRGEFQSWTKKTLARPIRWGSSLNYLLQFDIDAEPERGMYAIELCGLAGVRTNVMVFNRRVNRQRLREEREVAFTDYPLNIDLMSRLFEQGLIEIGYHCNAVEQSKWDLGAALKIFKNDVAQLRNSFPALRFFSAHGGVPGPDGKNNNSLCIDEELQSSLDLRWVHNSRSPSFSSAYSDGGFSNRSRPASRLDLVKFVMSTMDGTRHRILIHPQYFAYPDEPLNLQNVPPQVLASGWYQEIIHHYRPSESSRLFSAPSPASTQPRVSDWDMIFPDHSRTSLLVRMGKKLWRAIRG